MNITNDQAAAFGRFNEGGSTHVLQRELEAAGMSAQQAEYQTQFALRSRSSRPVPQVPGKGGKIVSYRFMYSDDAYQPGSVIGADPVGGTGFRVGTGGNAKVKRHHEAHNPVIKLRIAQRPDGSVEVWGLPNARTPTTLTAPSKRSTIFIGGQGGGWRMANGGFELAEGTTGRFGWPGYGVRFVRVQG